MPAGTYNIVRRIDIDPPVNGEPTWINYGHEVIGRVTVLEDNAEMLVSLFKTGDSPSINTDESENANVEGDTMQEITTSEEKNSLSKITGNVISDVLSSTKVNFVIGLLVAILFVLVCLTFRVSKLTYKK